MKRLILGAILAIALFFGITQLETAARQTTGPFRCWYNPNVEDCDTGGTVGCIDAAC